MREIGEDGQYTQLQERSIHRIFEFNILTSFWGKTNPP
jgi:hypothetical protein